MTTPTPEELAKLQHAFVELDVQHGDLGAAWNYVAALEQRIDQLEAKVNMYQAIINDCFQQVENNIKDLERTINQPLQSK